MKESTSAESGQATGQGAGKHTPGPWVENSFTDPGTPPYDQAPLRQVYGVEGGVVVGIARIERNHTEEGQANARLIAAAPDLLEACKGVYDEHEHDHDPRPCFVCSRMAAAIAKAEGR